MGEPFSLLLSMWSGDRPEYLVDAIRSSVDDQTLKPQQVVIVQDGPVGVALTRALEMIATSAAAAVDIVRLEHNVGLGPALNAGLDACRHEIVARMDADDVSVPHRFEVQVPLVASEFDLLGSGLLEFGADPGDIVGQRTPPTDPDEIRAAARLRDPFNHPTVVYRQSAVRAAGGYPDLDLMEDYLLFATMIAQGARVGNVAEPLVRYRVGAGSYARRGGTRLLRSELEIQRRFHAAGFTTRLQYARNVAVRGGYRLLPEVVRRRAYRRLVA